MFDPKAYKDEWSPPTANPAGSTSTTNSTPVTSTPNTSTTAGDLGDEKKEEKKEDFHHFDGTKAEVDNQISSKYNELDLDKKPEEKKGDSDAEIDKLAEELIGKGSQEDQFSKKEPGINEVVVSPPEKPKDNSFDSVGGNDKPSGALEQTLDSKTAEAIKKLESKKEDKNKEKSGIDEEIRNLDSKIKDLKTMAEELKNKIKQFDSKLEEIK